MAQQQAVLCTGNEWPVVVDPNPNLPPTEPPTPPIIEPRPVFFSAPSSCDFTCPDGSIFTYTVPAGFFFAFSQAAANAMAASFACNQVVANRSCFGPPPAARVCLEADYDSEIVVASAHPPITFTIQSGSLPPGITEAQTPNAYILSGTPSVPGDYTFLLRATDSTGSFIEKQIAISVFGIVNASPLPDAPVDTPYSEALVYAGTPNGAVVYSIILGALPTGLTLNSSTGEISGTPTTQESAGFSVRITDDGISCVKQFELEVTGGCVPTSAEDIAVSSDVPGAPIGGFSFVVPAARFSDVSGGGPAFIVNVAAGCLRTPTMTVNWSPTNAWFVFGFSGFQIPNNFYEGIPAVGDQIPEGVAVQWLFQIDPVPGALTDCTVLISFDYP